MKTLSSLLIATVLSGTITAMPVFAAVSAGQTAKPSQTQTSQKPAPMSEADQEAYAAMLHDAVTMMGHIGIANIALLHNIMDEATNNVNQALIIARKLEGETGKLNSDVAKLGKFKYHSANGEKHDYWLPIVNDTFVVNSFDSEYLKSKEPKAAEEDAQVVTTKIVLNTKQVRESLEKAASAIQAKNYGDAQMALMNAAQSTFTDETIGDVPLVTVHDNLVLAKNLVKFKDFDGASFALNHAKDALKEFQKTADKTQDQKVEKLRADIGSLQAEIAKDKSAATKMASIKNKPTLMQTIESHVSTWIHDVESLDSKKS